MSENFVKGSIGFKIFVSAERAEELRGDFTAVISGMEGAVCETHMDSEGVFHLKFYGEGDVDGNLLLESLEKTAPYASDWDVSHIDDTGKFFCPDIENFRPEWLADAEDYFAEHYKNHLVRALSAYINSGIARSEREEMLRLLREIDQKDEANRSGRQKTA